MGGFLTWVLAGATILGGIAAVGYFYDKWRSNRNWMESEKEVDSNWWESSSLKRQYENNGFVQFGWSNSDRVPERLTQGREIVYEMDQKNRIKYKLINKSKQVLLAKKDA